MSRDLQKEYDGDFFLRAGWIRLACDVGGTGRLQDTHDYICHRGLIANRRIGKLMDDYDHEMSKHKEIISEQ